MRKCVALTSLQHSAFLDSLLPVILLKILVSFPQQPSIGCLVLTTIWFHCSYLYLRNCFSLKNFEQVTRCWFFWDSCDNIFVGMFNLCPVNILVIWSSIFVKSQRERKFNFGCGVYGKIELAIWQIVNCKRYIFFEWKIYIVLGYLGNLICFHS